MAGVTNAKVREAVTNLHAALLGAPEKGSPGALRERAAEVKGVVTDFASIRRDHAESLADEAKAHANEKAGDLTDHVAKMSKESAKHTTDKLSGQISRIWDGTASALGQIATRVGDGFDSSVQRYDSFDAKLDAISAKLAHSRWTALIFAAWTVLCLWLGARLF